MFSSLKVNLCNNPLYEQVQEKTRTVLPISAEKAFHTSMSTHDRHSQEKDKGGTSSTWQRASTKTLLGTSLWQWKGRKLSSFICSLFDGEQSKNMFSKTRNKRPTIGREERKLVLFAVVICKKNHKESTKKLLEIISYNLKAHIIISKAT